MATDVDDDDDAAVAAAAATASDDSAKTGKKTLGFPVHRLPVHRWVSTEATSIIINGLFKFQLTFQLTIEISMEISVYIWKFPLKC